MIPHKLPITAIYLFFSLYSQGQNTVFNGYENLFTAPLTYVVNQTTDSLIIDGQPLEPNWDKAPWSEYFCDIEGDLKPAPAHQTRFKMLWDNRYVYIYLEMDEPHIWATLKRHDQVVFYDNDIEVFIDPDGDTQNYFEIEFNAFKTIFDLFLPRPYRNFGSAVIPWHVNQLKAQVWIDGTINNASDIDKKWCLEMAIPFQSISVGNDVQVPKNNSYWRINFSRVEWDVDLTAEGYKKRINPTTQKNYPEHNWVWSPQGVVDMHLPERWGYAFFSTTPVGSQTQRPQLTQLEVSKQHLWLVYYKQIEYKKRNNQFAKNLKQLDFKNATIDILGVQYNISMESTKNQFIVVIKNMVTNEIWQLNHLGHINQKPEN